MALQGTGASCSSTFSMTTSPHIEPGQVYNFTAGTNTAPHEFWNKGMRVNWLQADEAKTYWKTHYWNEDSLKGVNDYMDYSDLQAALAKGVEAGWITEEEAKTEFRAAFNTVRNADYEARNRAQQIENLEKALAEAKSAQAGK